MDPMSPPLSDEGLPEDLSDLLRELADLPLDGTLGSAAEDPGLLAIAAEGSAPGSADPLADSQGGRGPTRRAAADDHLPTLAEMVRTLANRIAQATQAPAAAHSGPAAHRYLTVSIGEARYALPLENVTEVGLVPAWTPLPQVPAWLVGIANLRGRIVALVDAARFFGGAAHGPGAPGRLVVVRPSGGDVFAGLIVGAAHGIREYPPERRHEAGAAPHGAGGRYLHAVCDDADGPVALLDLDGLLSCAEMQQFAAA